MKNGSKSTYTFVIYFLCIAKSNNLETSTGLLMPFASQSIGYILIAVKPGNVLISLKIISNLSFEQISQLLGEKTGTIKWRYYKAIYNLKLILSRIITEL